MKFTRVEVERIQKAFDDAYTLKAPMSSFLAYSGYSFVGIQDPQAPAETRDDFCLLVGVHRPLPQNVSLPSEYQGLRVFVKVAGKIRAY